MTAPWGVVYQDATGYITHANPAAERMLGLSVAQMQGRTSMNPEWRSVKKDGSPFPGSEHPSMVSLRTGKPQKEVVMGVYNPRRKGYTWININAVPQFRQGEPKPYEVYTTFEEIPGPSAPPAAKPPKGAR
jgi:PAS domain-containing protein